MIAVQAVGVKELSRKGVSDAEGAVSKVAGVSKQEGVKTSLCADWAIVTMPLLLMVFLFLRRTRNIKTSLLTFFYGYYPDSRRE